MQKTLKDRISGKRTAIVATIGPSSQTEDVLSEMVSVGLNMARLNFSHGDFAEHGAKVELIRNISANLSKPVAILQDLSGPEIRLGKFSDNDDDDEVTINEGDEVILTTRDVQSTAKIMTVDYDLLPEQVKPGEELILDDGKRLLKVKSVNGPDIITEVIVGGPIRGRRCLFAPDSKLSMSSLTDKDKADLEFAFEYDVDYIAMSFVRKKEDIEELRTILKDRGFSHIKIIAKIETKEAIENLKEIIESTDAVMVARGDLGVELPLTEVPILQKQIISLANEFGKPVITATQMLLSMIEKPTPTRAEVSDVANAILDGSDAIMLSEESAVGKYPVEAVKALANIAKATDPHKYIGEISKQMKNYLKDGVHSTDDVVSTSVAQTAKRVDANIIVAVTESGRTARLISRFKTRAHIVALTSNKRTYNQLALSGNVYPILVDELGDFSDIQDVVNNILKTKKLAEIGERVVISAGIPLGVVGGTNLLLVHKMH